MPLVLIPTDDMMILPGIAPEYARRGFDVVVGTRNFFLKMHRADLVHIQWPEEFADWKLPSPERMQEIRVALDYWTKLCPVLISVNNLYPHGYDEHPLMRELYSMFYERCSCILHYCQTSQKLVLENFPSARGRQNVVGNYFCYDRLLPERPDRQTARRRFGLSDDDFVVLVFGALRLWQEVRLLQKGYAKARVPHKRLLMAGRFTEHSGRWNNRFRRLQLRLWLHLHNALIQSDFIPDSHVHRYVESADAIIVPRIRDMTSGLVGLGLSFGRVLIAPDHGAFPEYLAGTENPFYKSGDCQSLALAIERASTMDRRNVEGQNRQIADKWVWETIIGTGLRAVGHREFAYSS
jgi:glycosyltransferase involved in cell wall biosynthesis